MSLEDIKKRHSCYGCPDNKKHMDAAVHMWEDMRKLIVVAEAAKGVIDAGCFFTDEFPPVLQGCKDALEELNK